MYGPTSVAWLASILTLHLVFEPEALQEAIHRRGIEIVLMLGRLVRLGLDQDRAREADLVLVLDHHRQEAAEIVLLALHIGVEDGVIAFAPAPQHVVGAAQAMRGFERIAHLQRRPRRRLRDRDWSPRPPCSAGG